MIAKAKKAVFISQIGKTLASGEKHDGRAPDYDDWELNGDIILWNESVLNYALPDSYFYYIRYPLENPLVTSIINLGIPHLIGGPILVDAEENLYSNSVILFDKNGLMEK